MVRHSRVAPAALAVLAVFWTSPALADSAPASPDELKQIHATVDQIYALLTKPRTVSGPVDVDPMAPDAYYEVTVPNGVCGRIGWYPTPMHAVDRIPPPNPAVDPYGRRIPWRWHEQVTCVPPVPPPGGH